MKKLLQASIVLFLFSASIALVQVSCSKSHAQPTQVGLNLLNKILFTKKVLSPGNSIEIWVADYDGSNQRHIPITFPAGVELNTTNEKATPRMSPDGQTIFFVGMNTTNSTWAIYSCGIAGGAAQEIITSPTQTFFEIYGAY